MRTKTTATRFSFAAIVAGVCLACFSCSSQSEGSAFLTNLNTIDTYIKQGQPRDALKLLKKTEKQASSAYARIGMYRRYMTMGERALAEKVLQRGLRRLHNNAELSAVYAQLLLRDGRIDNAIAVARCLEGTSYGSLYSEAVLKKRFAENRGGTVINIQPFLSDDLAPIYYDAYTGTNDSRWLRDSALVALAGGNYDAAAALQQHTPTDAKDALFWALVQYDARHYDLCLATLTVPGGDYIAQMTALASDAYAALGDADSAEELRAPLVDAWLRGEQGTLPCMVYLNSALWAWRHELYQRAYDLLLTTVTVYPDNAPALITYGNLAYEQSLVPTRTDLEQTLRRTPLRTQRMAEYDSRPKLVLSDALHRMDEALARQHEEGRTADDRLLAARAMLEIQSKPDMVATARLAYVWQLLEANEIRRNMYPPLLVQLAVHELLRQEEISDARTLFENYIDARYNFAEELRGNETVTTTVQKDVFGGERRVPVAVIPASVLKAAFGDRAALNAASMEVWEGETAAYFALLDKNVAAARRLYEYVLEADATHASVGSLAAVSSTANLAVIYSSTNDRTRALELYGQAAGRCSDSAIKSTLLYRTAVLQNKQNDLRGALLSLEYSLALNPANANARLLKRQLEH